MTTKTDEQQREAFEAWAATTNLTLGLEIDRHPKLEGYRSLYTEYCWAAWRTAIALGRQGRGEPVAKVTSGTKWGPGLAFIGNGKPSPKPGTLLYDAPVAAQPRTQEKFDTAFDIASAYLQSKGIAVDMVSLGKMVELIEFAIAVAPTPPADGQEK